MLLSVVSQRVGQDFATEKQQISENTVMTFVCLVASDSRQPQGLQPSSLLCPLDFPGKKTGGDHHSFPRGSLWLRVWTLVCCVSYFGRQFLYHWITCKAQIMCGGSGAGALLWGIWGLISPSRDWTRDPCIARQLFNHWTAKETPDL